MAMSLDGFIAGPNGGPGNPLGDGGPGLHQWVYELDSWLGRQGMDSGRVGQDDDLVKEVFGRTGAFVMGGGCSTRERSGGPTRRRSGRRCSCSPISRGSRGCGRAGPASPSSPTGSNTPSPRLVPPPLHLAHVLLGDRVRLFEGVDPERLRLEPTRVLGSEQVTHVRYRVSGG
jgi:hypothetical protein